ncbi:transcription factor S-II, central domain-containing protein [Zychaea mexicana]|uniref:transcription factor S-II, central domain-containing protein n=1 Tax=Zychaea mexicana TaxID=64656 RepID=UPI0022FF2657|nr:transcription factor S-II, central domain-containing protein [Zychaea mexicana]KAI9484735.1 transcription factor S-II, central domain-containing protein [Zychaea mexicana]
MRKPGDSDYVPTKSPSPPNERRSRTTSTTSSSSSSSSSSSTSTDNKKAIIKQQPKSSPPPSSKQSQKQQGTSAVAPEDDPIRKNVVKNMSTILKTIIESASDKDPGLFAASEHVTSSASSPSSAATTGTTTTAGGHDGAEQQQQQQQEEPSPQVMADQLANAIEQVMFKELKDPATKRAGVQYKNKFRSLLYNLKDKANKVFQLRVVTGELTPIELIKMSSEDMANPELRSKSLSMRQESIKNSIMKRANVPIIKKTHKGDIVMIGTPDKEESNQQQQHRHHYHHGQEGPRWINTASASSSVDALGGGDDSESRKSSFSETPTTPVAVSRDQREDDQRFEDILSKIGIGSRDDSGDNAGGSSKRGTSNSPLDGADRPKKRKVEIDMEKLLGDEDDYQPEFGDDDMEAKTTTPPNPPPASPPAVPSGPPKPPTIWQGRVNMPQVSEFEASARQVGGRTLGEAEWAEVLSPTMWIEGRIPVDRVTQYVTQTQYATSREIVLLEIEATTTTGDNYKNAQTLIKYFDSRKRFGVVGHNKTKVKDFYLIPLYKTQQLPDCLYVVRVEETQRDADMFLGVLVIQKHQERPPAPPPVVPAPALVPAAVPAVPSPLPRPPIVSQHHQQQQPAQQHQYHYQQPQQQQHYQVPTYSFASQQQQRQQQQQ